MGQVSQQMKMNEDLTLLKTNCSTIVSSILPRYLYKSPFCLFLYSRIISYSRNKGCRISNNSVHGEASTIPMDVLRHYNSKRGLSTLSTIRLSFFLSFALLDYICYKIRLVTIKKSMINMRLGWAHQCCV